jgi:hypothetical protein
MADKTALELIGAMLFAATLFVIVAGGFAVHAYRGPQVQADTLLHLAELPVPATGQAAILPAPR